LMPVLVDRTAPVMRIIEGKHRVKAAKELGLNYVPTRPDTVKRRTPEGYRKLMLSLNLARRHLTLEEQQALRGTRIKRVAEKRKAGKSLRDIANTEGVSLGQVQRDVATAKATVSPDTVEPKDGQVKGQDGKTRTAKPKRRPAPPKQAPAPPVPTPPTTL